MSVWRIERVPSYEEFLAIQRGETPRQTSRRDELDALSRAARRRKVEAAIALGMACFAVLFSLFALVMSIRVLP